MEAQEHLVGYLLDLVLPELQLLDVGGSFEGVRLYARQLVPLQLQLHQVRQPAEEAVGADAAQFVVVEQAAKIK